MPIPTFNPGVIDTDLSQIHTFQPTASAAQASVMDDVSNEFKKVSATWGAIEDQRVKAQQEAAGKVAAADPNFDPAQLQKQVITSADAAYRKGATASYMARLDIDTNAALTDINAQHFDDPATLRQAMTDHIQQTASTMPADIAVDYSKGAMQQAEAYYSNAVSSAGARARSQQKDDIEAGIVLSEKRLLDIGVPSTPAAQADYELEASKLQVKQQQAVQAGVYTPNQLLVRNQVLKGDLEDGTIYQTILEQPSANKFNFAMQVAEGKSGTALDQLPTERRLKAVTVAQQMLNAEDTQQKLNDKQQAKQASDTVWNASELVAADPTSKAARDTVSTLLTVANTPETVQQAAKLRSYVMNPSDPRFAASNPEYTDYLNLEAAKGTLTQNQIDTAWGNDSADSRIGTADRQRLSALVKARPGSVVGSPAWDTFVSKLQAEFPIRDRRRTGMGALLANLGINIPVADDGTSQANGLTDAQMKSNEKLIGQVLMGTQEKISKGTIDSEASLTNYSSKVLPELRQSFSGASVDKNNRAQTLTPDMLGAAGVAAQTPTMQSMLDKYQKDPASFARDVASGSLDARTANTLNRLMKGQK